MEREVQWFWPVGFWAEIGNSWGVVGSEAEKEIDPLFFATEELRVR